MSAIISLQQGLTMLLDTAFPCRCSSCGRVYESLDDFVSHAEPIPKTRGLKAMSAAMASPIEALNRRCACGSTMQQLVQERRSLTPEGRRRRKVFGELMALLASEGWAESDARAALLMTMRGEKSERLSALMRKEILASPAADT